MKNYITLILAMIPIGISAQDYYSTSQNLFGTELRIQLHNLIDDHTIISYSNCITALKESDQAANNSNFIRLVYKNTTIDNSHFASDVNNPVHLNYWNREHVWAKSLGSFGPGGDYEGSAAHTDLHNLKPSDMSINSDRANKGFDDGGTQHTEALDCNYTWDSWEAPDNVKGDIARILFYMDLRYSGGTNEPSLSITEELDTYPNPEIGVLSTLLEWHINDPVDEFELTRNEIIYDWQNNRNPFIDHPEYVARIWGEDSIQNNTNTASLIISEYIEGSSNNKALELYNTSTDTIELSDYKLLKITNGGEWGEFTYDLNGQLAANSTYTITHSSASEEINNSSDYQINLNHNGNDALAISYNDVIIDQVGMAGTSPTGGWDVAGVPTATKDHTLIRKATITVGNTNWEEAAGTTSENSEWIVLEQDNFDNIGTHTTNTLVDSQTINLPEGWFLIGISLSPGSSTIPSIFESINPNLIIVKDYLGNVYFPEYDFNNINDFELGMAYQIKTSAETTLEITGNADQTASSIPQGWYMFSALNNLGQNLEQVFNENIEDLIIIKDYIGNAYLPSYNFNGIGDMINGYGYQIKTSNSISIQW